MRTASALPRVRRALAAVAGAGVVASLAAVVVLTGWSAVGRRTPVPLQIPGSTELIVLASLWLYFLGGAHATVTNANVQAGLGPADGDLQPGWRRAVAPLVTAIVSLTMAYMAWRAVSWSMHTGRVTVQLQLAAYWGPLAILSGFTLIAATAIVDLIELATSNDARSSSSQDGAP